jgi:hypothetical protein
MATSFIGGGSRCTRREPPTLGKQLVNFITCVASRVHLFCNLQRWERTHAVLVIDLYELIDPTTYLIELLMPPNYQEEDVGVEILLTSLTPQQMSWSFMCLMI